MILLPSQEKRFNQNNQSDVLGNIWSSFNLDLRNNLGRLRISPRVMISTQQSDVSTLSTAPCAFRRLSNNFYTIAGVRIFVSSTSLLASNWDVDTNTPTTMDVQYSDLEYFNGTLYATGGNTTLYKTPGTWSSVSTSLNANTPHMMTVYGDRLYITDLGYKIYSLNTSDSLATSGSNTLTLGSATNPVNLTFIRSSSDRIWIGTLGTAGGKGYVYEWDGVSSQVTKRYRLQAQGALACVIKDDIPWVVDTNGRLLAWNGATFIEKGRLPLNKDQFLVNATGTSNNRFIHPNGISIIDGQINLLINNVNDDNGATINENLPSGIWEYDESIGLYHKQSLSLQDDDTAAGTITDYAQNRVSVVGALADMKTNDTAAAANGTFLAGAVIYTNASDTGAAVFIDDSDDAVQKSGYFVTTWIDSQNVQDVWQKIFVTYKQLLNSTDKIVLKYRTTEAVATEISITWVDTTHFTTATDISGKVGQEVEVVQGTGSGLCSHITAVTGPAGGLYTATVDETYTGVETGTAKARLQAWVKLGTVQNQTDEWSQFPIGKHSSRIQLKCCLLVTGKNELHRLALINQAQRPLA